LTWFFGALAVLALAAGATARRRAQRARHEGSGITDDDVRQIEQRGWLAREADEPLDLDEIREAEERFWEPTWDRPEER